MPRARLDQAERAARARESPERKQQRDAELLRHYRDAFGTPSGRIVLADLLRRCGYFDPNGDERSAGRRDMGIHLIAMITTEPDALVRLALTSEVGELMHE